MKTWSLFAVGAIATISSATVLAASPPAEAGNAPAPAASAAPAPSALKDARSLKNDRLRKCKYMEGDEKKACQRNAQADFDKKMGRARAQHAQTTNAGQSQ